MLIVLLYSRIAQEDMKVHEERDTKRLPFSRVKKNQAPKIGLIDVKVAQDI